MLYDILMKNVHNDFHRGTLWLQSRPIDDLAEEREDDGCWRSDVVNNVYSRFFPRPSLQAAAFFGGGVGVVYTTVCDKKYGSW